MSPGFHRLAEQELLDEVARYEQQAPGLGADFLRAVEDACDDSCSSPAPSLPPDVSDAGAPGAAITRSNPHFRPRRARSAEGSV